MAWNIITATKARNNLFNLLDTVAATGNPIYIKRGREVKVRITPVNKKDFEGIKGLKFFRLLRKLNKLFSS